jgi:hypothetical protein
MFALKRHGQVKGNTLDHHFASEEFGASDTAFWDDTDRRSRLRRSTSFESILEATSHVDHEPAVTQVVGSMRNLLLQSKNKPSSISNKKSFGVSHAIQLPQPNPPLQAKVIGSVSHMLLQSKNTFAATSNKSFSASDQLFRKAASYKLDNSGEFKYPSPKRTDNNMFFDLIDKKQEKRVSMEKENGLVGNAPDARSASSNLGVKRNSEEQKRPTSHLLRQQSDSSLFFGSRKATIQDEVKANHCVNTQLNISDHSLNQRRSRRRLGVQKIDRSAADKPAHSTLAVKRAGSDPTLETRSRRTAGRKNRHSIHHLGHQNLHDKSQQLLSSNKTEAHIDRSALSNTHTRGRRIVIGLTKGEDDDDMHNTTTDKQKRKRRHRIDMTERGHSSSKSFLDFDGDDHTDREDKDDQTNSNDAYYTLLETAPAVEDKLQTSDHSIDILEEPPAPQNEPNETNHRNHSHKPRKKKEVSDTQHGMRKHSNDKEIRLRRHDTKSRPSPESSGIHLRHNKSDPLKVKVRKNEKKLSAFELRAHASCDFATGNANLHRHDRNHFSFHFDNSISFLEDDFDINPFTEHGASTFDNNREADHAMDKESSTVGDETASLVKQINTLDFPLPSQTEDDDDDYLGIGKSTSNHTASSKTSKCSRKTSSSLVHASCKKT